MTRFRTSAATALALALMLGGGPVFGQGAQGQQQMQQAPTQQGMPMHPGMTSQGMGPGMMGQMPGSGLGGSGQWPGMGPGTMAQGHGLGPMGAGVTSQRGMWHMGPHMMSPAEMQEMMAHMGGMMGQGMGSGMMGQGMSPDTGGWSGLEGRQVVPMMQLSTDDVRGFLERHLAALGNERLKVGKVAAVDNDTIAADIVTVDDSLVGRFSVDRHTGLISAAG
jgi:hypothetical protein